MKIIFKCKKILKYFSLIILFGVVTSCSSSSFSTFITTDKDKLIEDEKEFRFISFNIPNILYVEDNFPFEETNPWRLPNEFEIRDALTSIKKMGGKVARTYTITVKRNTDQPNIIRHVEAPGVFNEEPFIVLDKVLQIANEIGIRLIIPLVDNWWWMGGVGEYAAFRNKEREEFWSDTLLISDFKKTIDFVLNRKNTFTGELYKNDKAILGWETGNELSSTYEWQSKIAKYIKSIDKNHLVIENEHVSFVNPESINDPNIDVLSTHYYEPSKSAVKKILQNVELVKGKKPYFVGEFGFIPSYQFSEIIDTVINNKVSGALLWSLRFRNRDGGFYKHYERDGFSAYNFPGFAFNKNYDEKAVLKLVEKKANEISENKNPDKKICRPNPPKILPTNSVYKISWQGSTGAISYVLERKELEGDWKIIDVVEDSKISYKPLYIDRNAEKGKSYFYRMRAWNGNMVSELSNEIGPIEVNRNFLIDELFDNSLMYEFSDSLKFLSMEDVRKAKEERSRLTGIDSSYIIYKLDEPIIAYQIEVFHPNENSNLKIFGWVNGNQFEEINSDLKSFEYGVNDYGYFKPVRYSNNQLSKEFKYLKIMINNSAQISRIEIEY